MTESYQMFPSIVAEVEQLTPLVKRFTFKRIDGESYPEFTAGSHMFVKMNDKLSNAYSLVSNAKDLSSYQICVQQEVNGKGGSTFMHEHCVKGFQLEISSPKNLFELSHTGQKHLLIAGGIGITPFMTQMEELAQRNADYELKYRHRDEYVHWEQFSSNVSESGNAFTVILAKSNHRIEVQHDQTILQAIESLNIDVECLCREGVCGTCETVILEGEAEHLDKYLDDDEKISQKTMMICVSRAKNKEITLDL